MGKTSGIADWTPALAADFGRAVTITTHDLHTRALFDDAGLIDLLDRYPRERLGVFTMGHDPVDWRSWALGDPGDLSGAELMQAVADGRIWLNLREANAHLPEHAALCDAIFAEKEARVPGLKTFKRDLGVLISSPGAQVFYHLDSPLVSLWQIRGEKTVRVYRPAAPHARPEQIEAVVLRETAEQLPFDPAWDEDAQTVLLKPGMMVAWPQNAPHRIVNGPMVNVSLSLEYMTPAALLRANVIYANGVLRRRLGWTPAIQTAPDPRAFAKFALARAFKALKVHKAHEHRLPVRFALADGVPGAPQVPLSA
jgi:hypothetical protein